MMRASASVSQRAYRASRASENGAAHLERASAPSRPERRAPAERRAGVARSEREVWGDVELAREERCAAGSYGARTALRGSSPATTLHPERDDVPKIMSSGRTGTRSSARPVAARIAAT